MKKIRHLIKSDNGQLLTGNIGASALGLVTFMLLARLFSQQIFGQWALFIAAAGLADLIRTGLIRQALVRSLTVTTNKQIQASYKRASAQILILVSGGLALILAIIHQLTPVFAFSIFLKWYPIWLLVSVPHMLAAWLAQANKKFRQMVNIRMMINALFLAFVLSAFWMPIQLEEVIVGHLGVQLLVSLWLMKDQKLHYRDLLFSTGGRVKEILQFGKYNVATLVGTNLLKTADHLIIGIMLGTEAVAIYAIPLKVLEVLEIPLRGFVMTTFPKLTKSYVSANQGAYQQIFNRWVFRISFLFIPVTTVMLIFPSLPVTVLAGAGYQASEPLIRVFALVMLLIPLDKFLGVAFDSINQPSFNARKVWLMVMINVVGDFVVLFFFQSLLAVAVVSLLALITSTYMGVHIHPWVQMNRRSFGMVLKKPLTLFRQVPEKA